MRRATRCCMPKTVTPIYFYPRSPCGERPVVNNIVFVPGKFLSTLSLRRATGKVLQCVETPVFLSTLSLRRATLKRFPPMCTIRHFYPRSPCGERRSQQPDGTTRTTYFYPRSPCGERPDMAVSYSKGIKISIHALLAESDHPKTLSRPHNTNFYPRSPCGERPRERTSIKPIFSISIHALLAESDLTLI